MLFDNILLQMLTCLGDLVKLVKEIFVADAALNVLQFHLQVQFGHWSVQHSLQTFRRDLRHHEIFDSLYCNSHEQSNTEVLRAVEIQFPTVRESSNSLIYASQNYFLAGRLTTWRPAGDESCFAGSLADEYSGTTPKDRNLARGANDA